MSSRRTRDDPRKEKDRILIESPGSSDVDMVDGRPFDRQSRRLRMAREDDDQKPERERGRGDRRYDRPPALEDTHSRVSAPPPYQRTIPGLSSYNSQAEPIGPQDQRGASRDARYDKDHDFSIPYRASRRRSPSPRRSSFAGSQGTTAYERSPHRDNRPCSPTRRKSDKTERSRRENISRARSRSRSQNPVVLPKERREPGSDFHLWRVRNPVGETTQRRKVVRRSSSDVEKGRHGQRRRKK